MPADHALLRKLNRATVLDCLQLYSPLSRAEIAARTGLNRSTVTHIINELIDYGIVQETEYQDSKGGRPGMLLRLNPAGGFAVGIDIEPGFITVLLTDLSVEVLYRRHLPLAPGSTQESVLGLAEGLVQEALDFGARQGLRPLGIGAAVPGLVDVRQSRLVFAPNLKWRDIPLRQMWTKRFRLPFFLENDANAGALGEYYYGAARRVDNFIYLSTGIGLGGGIMIDGKLFRGSRGYGGEIGHVSLCFDGDPCACGKRGCWETYVEERAFLRRLRQALSKKPHSRILELAGGDPQAINLETAVQAAELGDPLALQAFEEQGYFLGFGAGNLANLYNPEMIILGGVFNVASPFILPSMEKTLQENSLAAARASLKVAPSACGTDATLKGAVALVLDQALHHIGEEPYGS